MLGLLKNLKLREWIMFAISVGFIVMQVWLDLLLPDYMSEITRLIQIPGSPMSEIWIAGGYMLACALGSALSSIIVGYFAARIAAGFSRTMRERIFCRVEDFSVSEINRFSTASLITRSTNDITQVQMFVAMGMQVIVKAPILAVWAVVKMLNKSWQWSMLTAVAVILMLVMISVIMAVSIPRFKKIQKLTDNLNNVTRENLTGLRVVKAYNAEQYQEDKFAKANGELTDTNLFVNKVMAIMHPGMNIIMNGLNLGIFWIGAMLINTAGAITDRYNIFADMVVFTSYAMQVVMAFMMLIMIFIMLPRAQVSAKRILEILKTEPDIADGEYTDGKNRLRGQVEFKDVSFRYHDGDGYAIENISFTAKPGETVAFIGATGSGKSTLINMIPRFYDASEGEVLVAGVNVKDYKVKSLRNKLGYVSQKAVLFSGDVKGNVNYGDNGKPSDINDIKKAIEVAQAKEFVEKMNGDYDAAIAQGGTNVSGGQKQRLSIARAIARDPEIYIFDDSFSALDYKTDKVLRGALKEYTGGATTLIVAQRIGTIKNADKIIVLDEGKMAGIGTHEELLKDCEIYRQIAYSQLSKEELGNE